MKFIRNMLDKHEHHFLKGGKLERFYPLWEAQETFLFTSDHVTKSGPHVRDSIDSKRLMMMVVFALIPCVLFGAYNTGLQAALSNGQPSDDVMALFWTGMVAIMPIIVVSYAAGGIWEVLFAVIRKHEINEGFLVTGLLFPLVCPPEVPLWQVAAGVSFGVVIGKEIFGGTGMNILNPALTARAFLYFSYPAQISGDKVWILNQADGVSGATPLNVAALAPNGANAMETLNNFSNGSDLSYGFWDMFWGFIPGSIGETSAAACIIGAIILIITGVGSWRVMGSVIVGALITALGLNMMASDALPGMLSLSPQHHLVMGGLMFGAVFMATDPVSAARTLKGQYIYGFFIGVLTILIRIWNPAYPEGVMLAVLFMNVFAPLIDHMVVNVNVKRRLKRVAT